MTDATSRPGSDGTRGEGTIGRGTGNDPAGSHSPLVTPTENEAPDLKRSGTPGDEGGFGTDTSAVRETGRDAGSDTVGGVGTGAGGLSGREGHGERAGRESRLLPHEECDKLSTRLQHAVAGFVDEPRSAVEEADHVLEEVAARFADAVKERRRTLRNSWQTGDGGRDKAMSAGDTEQLRLALRDYRELTERLLHS
ncbi:hypothetical protein ACIQJT_15740 [Streptomyces sp. NPDC091972]|uniref:hypothetical protein n=1 Tax=Streptomyces sp. NPDC091972 TaxID=3366007 RepID=UPI003816C2B3